MNLLSKQRSRTLLFFILLFFCSLTLLANNQEKITLNFSSIPLKEAIIKIEKKIPHTFFYDEKSININQQVSLNVKEVTLHVALTKLFTKTHIEFEVSNRHILLFNKKTKSDKQKSHKIIGSIKDEKGEPIIGANIVVEDSQIGTISDIDGNFALDVPNGSLLSVRYIGYMPFKQLIETENAINVVLHENAKNLSEVVVTALGIKREKKMLGYSVQELSGDDLNSSGDPSVIGALQGKVAGLQMNMSSTGLNGSTKITIRGNSSLTDNNQPLWVVDGIPFSDENNSTASLYTGIDRGGVSVDINPDDVESISVLKGPNAAALYGSRAGNGVILITTKKGSKSDGFGVNYNGSFTWSQVSETLDMQDKYGQGTNGVYADDMHSFGPILNGIDHKSYTGEIIPFKQYGNKLQDFFQTGFSQNHNVSIGNVKENANYRASFGRVETDGVFSQEHLRKTNLDMSAGMKMNKYLSINSKVALSRTTANNRPIYGKDGVVYQLLLVPNNIRLADLQNYSSPEKAHINWFGPEQNVLNPYYVSNQYGNEDDRWRAFGYYSLKINFTDWLYITAKYAFDYYNTNIKTTDLTKCLDVTSIKDQTQDRLERSEIRFFEQNAEFLLIGNNKIGNHIQLGYSLGGNIMSNKRTSLDAFSVNMRQKFNWQMNSALGVNGANVSYYKKQINSIFGTFQASLNSYLTLDLTARNDWSSTLPKENRSFFYPSANLSFVGTDFMQYLDLDIPTWLNFAKLRLSYAQAGKDTDPYSLYNWLIYKQTGGKYPEATTPSIKANADLKPEKSTSYEGGIEMKLFQNRFGIDFTYYLSSTKNQVMTIPMTGSWNGKLINAGIIQNKGFEIMLYGTPVQMRDFTFDLTVNMAHNLTTIKELYATKKEVIFNTNEQNVIIDVGAKEGGKLGDIYPKHAYTRDNNGNIIVRNGVPLPEDLKSRKAIGNIQPKLLMSVTPSFSYKNFFLSALFDMKFGGDIVSLAEAVATGAGTAKRTEERNDIIIKGVNEDGSINTTPISAEKYYTTIGGENGFAEEFLYDASFIKLKEVSFGYSFPSNLLKRTPLTALKFSVIGRNLCYLLKHTPGTSPEGGFNTTMFSQALDFTSIPFTRTIGFSIYASF